MPAIAVGFIVYALMHYKPDNPLVVFAGVAAVIWLVQTKSQA